MLTNRLGVNPTITKASIQQPAAATFRAERRRCGSADGSAQTRPDHRRPPIVAIGERPDGGRHQQREGDRCAAAEHRVEVAAVGSADRDQVQRGDQ